MFICVNSDPAVGYKFGSLIFLSPQNHPSPRDIYPPVPRTTLHPNHDVRKSSWGLDKHASGRVPGCPRSSQRVDVTLPNYVPDSGSLASSLSLPPEFHHSSFVVPRRLRRGWSFLRPRSAKSKHHLPPGECHPINV